MTQAVFRILSIDGGGIRGVFPAHILACIKDRLGLDPYEYFDMLAGTSTGSIVAAGISCRKEPSHIVGIYRERSSEIFGEEIGSWLPRKYKPAMHSMYKSRNLIAVLNDEFGETTLGEIEKPLLIPATDIGHGSVHVFKSSYSVDFTRDAGVAVRDAVLASCSAPTFFDPVRVENYLLADGGLWANNPALAAVIDAQYRLGIDRRQIRVLSLGTGQSRTAFGTNPKRSWGLLNGWRSREFVSFLLSLQAQSTQNYLQILLDDHQLLRLDFESDNPLPIDEPTIIDDLISRADRTFTHESQTLIRFLNEDK